MGDDRADAVVGDDGGAPTEVVVMPAATSPRRRWVRWLVLGLAVLALVAASIAIWLWTTGRAPVPGLDDAARAEVTQRIQQEVSVRLGIEPSDVAVDLGAAPILPQLERRLLDEATIVVRLPADRATALVAEATGLDRGALALGQGTVRLQLEVDAVLTKVTLGVGFSVTPADGELEFAPTEFVLGGAPIPVADLLATPFIGDLVRPLAEPRSFCVASLLPAPLSLSDVAVTPAQLELTISGRDIPLDEAALSTTGTCA